MEDVMQECTEEFQEEAMDAIGKALKGESTGEINWSLLPPVI
jgi:hypothetical protein